MILADIWSPRPKADVTWSALDDRWYEENLGFNGDNSSGLYVSADTVFRCATVLAAVRFIATSCALCPAQVVRRDGDSRVSLPGHYAQQVLRNPNERDTDFEWMELNVLRIAVWGNSHNRIVVGRPWQLIPMEPWRVRVEDAAADGSLIYSYRPVKGERKLLTQDEVLHFKGTSVDGVNGMEMFRLMQNVVGIALQAERHLGTFLRKGARAGGVLVPAQPLEEAQMQAVNESFNRAMGGPDKTGAIAMLPFGFDFKSTTVNARDAQTVELKESIVGDILRFLGVPGVVVGYSDKTATYASAKEFFESGGIKHCILPWLRRMERRLDKQLIFDPSVFVRYNLDVLLRANTEARYSALFRATGRPFLTGNEARSIEDYNAVDDPTMDEVLRPTNMTTDSVDAALANPAGAGPPPTGATDFTPAVSAAALRGPATMVPRAASVASDPIDEAHVRSVAQVRSIAEGFARDAASRLVRRELAAVRDRVSLAARDEPAWRAWVASYYGRFAADVAAIMRISDSEAETYAFRHRDQLLASGIAVADAWEAESIEQLLGIHFGE